MVGGGRACDGLDAPKPAGAFAATTTGEEIIVEALEDAREEEDDEVEVEGVAGAGLGVGGKGLSFFLKKLNIDGDDDILKELIKGQRKL